MIFNRSIFIIGFLTIIAFSACEEIGPDVNFSPPPLSDTTFVSNDVPAAHDKVVLLEDFSGVHCANCPNGNAAALALIDAHPGRVIVLTIHGGDFANPYSYSNENFSIEETEALNLFMGIEGWPAAVIDRYQFAGTSFFPSYSIPQWGPRVEERLATTPPVNINIENSWDADTRVLEVAVEAIYTEEVAEDNRLSIFVLESDIIDPQLQPDNSVDTFYVHKHVVRDMLTASTGDALLNTGDIKEVGRTIIKVYAYVLPEEWDENHCEIVASVHQSDTDSKVVLQSALRNVIE